MGDAVRTILKHRAGDLPHEFAHLDGPLPLLGSPDPSAIEAIGEAMPWMASAISAIASDLRLRKRTGGDGAVFRPLVIGGASADARHDLFLEAVSAALTTRGVSLPAARGNSASQALRAIATTKCANPVVMIPDAAACPTGEIDTLAKMLDRLAAAECSDHVSGGVFDASAVSWMLVAEKPSDLPVSLLDRCRVVYIRDTDDDRQRIRGLLAERAVKEAATELGVKISDLPQKALVPALACVPAPLADLRRRAIEALASVEDWQDEHAVAHAITSTSRSDIPHAVVCGEISGVGENGLEFVRTYERLTRPLPMPGGGISPTIFCDKLKAEFPWLSEPIDLIAGDLELAHAGAAPRFEFRPLMINGPAGIGKSRFARRMADLAGVGYRYLAAGGLSGGAEFAGTGRSAPDPHPSTPVLAIFRSATANPIVFVDEIDKIRRGEGGGTLEDALLSVLESETAKRYFDECLQSTVDLSHVSYIFAVNEIHSVNPILRDRIRIVNVKRPPPEAFPIILTGILDEVAHDYSIPRDLLPGPDYFPSIAQEFRSGKSIRQVKRMVLRMIPAFLAAGKERVADE